MFTKPTIADLNITREDIISNATKPPAGFDGAAGAKEALYASAAWLVGEAIHGVVAPAYAATVEMAELMGDDPADAVKEEFGEKAGSLSELSALITKTYLPDPGHEGKWLAKFGLVDKDWYELAGIEYDPQNTPEFLKRETPVTKEPTQAEQIAAAVLSAPAAPPAPPAATAQTDAPPAHEEPTNADQSEEGSAFDFATFAKHLMAGAALDVSEYAKLLGVSRTSASNWLNGKPPRKITPVQLRAMRRDLKERIDALAEAAKELGA